MEWIKIPTDEILLSGRSDWQNYALIKYMALYCQLEQEPNDFQLRRILTPKQFNFVQKEKQIVLKIVQNCIENVSKKRNRNKLHYEKKCNKINENFKIQTSESCLSDGAEKKRKEYIIINNNNTPPISPPVGGNDQNIKNQDEDKIKNLCPVSVPSGWKDVEMPKDEIIIPLELREAMKLWLEYRKEIKKPYKPMGLRECVKKLEKLSGNDRAVAVEIVRESISNGWTGLFPLKKKLDMKGKDEYKSIVDMMENFIEGEEGC